LEGTANATGSPFQATKPPAIVTVSEFYDSRLHFTVWLTVRRPAGCCYTCYMLDDPCKRLLLQTALPKCPQDDTRLALFFFFLLGLFHATAKARG